MHVSKNNALFEEKFFLLDQNSLVVFYGLLLFLTPIFLTHQLVAGTIVNALLIHAGLNFSLKRFLPLCILPSIGVILSGFLFGNLTSALLFVLPFIWVSNFLIVFLTKKLFIEKNNNYFLSTTIASMTKTIFLFISVSILFLLGFVPIVFLTAFGLFQFITAESGAILIGFLKLTK